MKNLKKIVGYSLAIGLMLGSCDLDREPNDYVDYNKSYLNLQDAKKWDNGIYSTLRGKFGGGYVLPQEIQADMLNAHAAYNGLYSTFHDWRVKAEDEAIKAIYHSYYMALVDVNIVLESAPKLAVKEEERVQVETFLGHAYLARAFYHFNLALRWGVPYKAESAATDLCVPLSTKAFDLTKPARASNEETYKLILSDLDQAETKLKSVVAQEGTKELSSDVAIALRARVYLYMGRMSDALAEAQKLITSNRYPLIAPLDASAQDPTGERHPFVQMWHYDSGKEQIWQPYVERPNEVPTTTNLYGADLDTYTYWAERGVKDMNFNKPTYLPTGTVIYELFKEEKDRRIPAYFEYVSTTVKDKEIKAELFVISKFKGNPKYSTLASSQWGGYVPNGVCAPKPFRIAEQYLIAAEAAYETSQVDLAKQYLNELRQSRGLEAVTAVGEELRDAIRAERGRELIYEGYRLWDLRRWGLGITSRTRQGMHERHMVDAYFFASEFAHALPIEATNPKFVWGFPREEAAQINKKLKQNEGW